MLPLRGADLFSAAARDRPGRRARADRALGSDDDRRSYSTNSDSDGHTGSENDGSDDRSRPDDRRNGTGRDDAQTDSDTDYSNEGRRPFVSRSSKAREAASQSTDGSSDDDADQSDDDTAGPAGEHSLNFQETFRLSPLPRQQIVAIAHGGETTRRLQYQLQDRGRRKPMLMSTPIRKATKIRPTRSSLAAIAARRRTTTARLRSRLLRRTMKPMRRRVAIEAVPTATRRPIATSIRAVDSGATRTTISRRRRAEL